MIYPQAFPQELAAHESEYNLRGMTLRDYFAAAALTGLIAEEGGYIWKDLAPNAYKLADEMLKEREKTQ